MKISRAFTVVFVVVTSAVFTFVQAAPGAWLPVARENLCVTEGSVEKSSGDHMMVDAPKMRAYSTIATAPSAEVRFAYLGPSSKDSPLGSGQMRRQFGIKLHAQDSCNLVYVMWRIEPESQLVVSVKANPGQRTSAQCSNHGYRNIKPAKTAGVPRLEPGKFHTFRAEMTGDGLRVFTDNREVWTGSVGRDAAGLEGPIGIRSDNARIEFDLKGRRPEANTQATACSKEMGSD